MTVSELIAQLQSMQQDAPVHFAYNYGDRWHTQVAPEVSTIDVATVKYSNYHSTDAVVDVNEYNDSERTDVREVVVIK